MSVQLKTIEKKTRNRFTASQKLAILKEWQASGNGVELSERYGIHPMTLYRWKRLELGGSRISQRDKIQTRSTGQGPGEGESEAEGYCDSSIPGTDAVEKR